MEIHHIIFAKLSWFLLIFILYVRPLADIFRWKIFFEIMRYRKWMGIVCGVSAILHAFLFLYKINSLGSFFTRSAFWHLDSFLGWGSLALVAMMFPLLTSNLFSQKLLKRNWKRVQQVTYLTFVFTGIHVSMVRGSWLSGLVPAVVWVVLWVWAWSLNR